ncbi:MAG: ribonuclease R [Alphaproteobacteria bacterium]|jgi:ribonuclease R|nr:ribonuclease R [Alphaproteobacteria bacterium]
MAGKPAKPAPLPSKAEILRFINDSPQAVGKREIARAFRVRGADRAALGAMMRELADEGLIERGRRRRVRPQGTLPSVAVIEVTLADTDGVLHARPATWPEDEPPPAIVLAPQQQRGPAIGEGERLLARLARVGEGYEARIIRRLPQASTRVVGVLSQIAGGWRLMPSDRRQKLDLVVAPENLAGAGRGELVAAELIPGRRLGLREARVVERLGHFGDPRAMSLIAIQAHDIPVGFAAAAMAEAEAAEPAALESRTDLRRLPLVTIDGADARDFDDAVFAAPDDDPANRGGWRIVVAIADVAHYVSPGSALDKAARERGNSVYFPDRAVPMLPERLSTGLCCLRPDEERAALAVTIQLDAHGNKLAHRFERALIRSHGRLTYDAVQAAKDGDAAALPTAEVADRIGPLYGAWNALMLARGRREPLDLELKELQVVLDDDGHIAMVRPRDRFDSHRLIEEFMIAANVAAAEELERLRMPCIYRIHESPTREKLQALRDFLKTLGLSFTLGEVTRPKLFNRVLAKAKASAEAEVVNQAVLRAQAQALYSPDNIGHFGLSLGRYAHFTSPIRRYSDLVVHRALIRGLGLGRGALGDDEIEALETVAEHVSMTERRAMAAERDAMDRYLTAYLANHVEAEFEGVIAGVTRAGLFVRLDETGADGLVPISSLGREYFHHDEAAHSLVGADTGQRHRLGDRVRVKLVEADTITGSLVFRLTDWEETEAPPGPRRKGGRRPRRSPRGRRRI